ncbi:MAG: FAD-binding protein, partial [Candidatus Margulisbacteria bacterium]|nr:FAD-binding protein [Candidatus Margulisiibacteriota bacterium]
TNPTVSTGDGIALGFEAGCEVTDMEFVQFHPTSFYEPQKQGHSFLISETVRGEGGIMVNVQGDRFMKSYHPDAELAPRDVVARAVYQEMQKTESPCEFLDMGAVSFNLKDRFPTIYAYLAARGIDMATDRIPVVPSAHYFIGGLRTDIHGKTSVEGCYAVGETASLGIHGANRLASNSLLEGLVFGYRVAKDALHHATEALSTLEGPYPIPEKGKGLTPTRISVVKTAIQSIMWNGVGIIRSRKGLEEAISKLDSLSWIHKVKGFSPELGELQNMQVVAKLCAQFALEREESRGGHFRSDFPDKDSKSESHNVLRVKRS